MGARKALVSRRLIAIAIAGHLICAVTCAFVPCLSLARRHAPVVCQHSVASLDCPRPAPGSPRLVLPVSHFLVGMLIAAL